MVVSLVESVRFEVLKSCVLLYQLRTKVKNVNEIRELMCEFHNEVNYVTGKASWLCGNVGGIWKSYGMGMFPMQWTKVFTNDVRKVYVGGAPQQSLHGGRQLWWG